MRVETRCHLNAHTGREQQQIEDSEILLLVPWYFVTVNDPSHRRIAGNRADDFMSEDRHGVVTNDDNLRRPFGYRRSDGKTRIGVAAERSDSIVLAYSGDQVQLHLGYQICGGIRGCLPA